MSDEVNGFIKGIMEKGIKAVMVDMDKTLVSEHSRGCLPRAELQWFVKSMTPTTKSLIPALVKAGLVVCIGTYSDELYAKDDPKNQIAGTPLVHELLKPIIEEKQLNSVLVIGLNPELYVPPPPKAAPTPGPDGKIPTSAEKEGPPAPDPNHVFFNDKIASLLKKAQKVDKQGYQLCYTYPPMPFKNHHLYLLKTITGIDFKQMILIDDSIENVEGARKLGVYAVHVNGNSGLQSDMLKSLQ